MRTSFFFALIVAFLPLSHIEASTYGACRPQPSSKRYIQNDFQAPYPKTVVFSCEYTCQGRNGEEQIWGISSVRVSSVSEDAKKVVCQGVKVKRTSWGYDFAGIESFYAFDTQIPEIKKWAFKNLEFRGKFEKQYLENLKSDLQEVSQSYKNAYHQSQPRTPAIRSMFEASQNLDLIIEELPERTHLLSSYLDQLRQQNGNIPQDLSPNYWLLTTLRGVAKWRLPLF